MCVSCLIGLAGVDGLGSAAPTYAQLLTLCSLADDSAKGAICTSCLNKAQASGIPADVLKDSPLDVFMLKCEKDPTTSAPPAPAASTPLWISTHAPQLALAGGCALAAFLIWRHYAR